MYFRFLKISTKLNTFIFLLTSLLLVNDVKSEVSKSENQLTNTDTLIVKKKVTLHEYILGPGDFVFIEFPGIKELSGKFEVGPDGFIYLPEFIKVNADGLTVNELVDLLKLKYKNIVKSQEVYVTISSYRPVRVFVTGEVKRPGFYTIIGSMSMDNKLKIMQEKMNNDSSSNSINIQKIDGFSTLLFPTVFDAIRVSKGITPYSDLSSVKVIRGLSKGKGGRKMQTNLNFLRLFSSGDQSQNIRIYDGDTIMVGKSQEPVSEQLTLARSSNLSPGFIQVYVSGNVNSPGLISIPQGAGLNQAIAVAGGERLLSGKIEFLRFTDDGNLEKRNFKFSSNSKINTYKNPHLMDGDIININKSLLGKSSEIVNQLASPIVTSYSLYNIFNK